MFLLRFGFFIFRFNFIFINWQFGSSLFVASVIMAPNGLYFFRLSTDSCQAMLIQRQAEFSYSQKKKNSLTHNFSILPLSMRASHCKSYFRVSGEDSYRRVYQGNVKERIGQWSNHSKINTVDICLFLFYLSLLTIPYLSRPCLTNVFLWLFDDLEFKIQNSFVKQARQTQYGAVLIGISD